MSSGTGEGQSSQPATPRAPDEAFISYASQDISVAAAIVEALERKGVRCWIAPRNVRPGTVYADAIVGAINESKALVLVLSANAMSSAHVGREVERAASKRKQLIAFRIDSAPLSQELEYFLSNSQWIDMPKQGMPTALTKLAESLTQGSTTSPKDEFLGSGRGSKRTISIIAGLVGVSFAVAVGVHFSLLNRGGSQTSFRAAATETRTKSAASVVVSDKSIAVLPFVDMSEKHDQEYFSDGLSEELIDHLAHIPDLKVIARTSSFAFKGKNEDMRSIATKLGVANLLEGSVRKSGGELRITAQLIRASDGVDLWSESYDRKLTDIFKVQEEISTTVAKALNIALSTSGSEQAVSNGTANVESYNLLLQGSYFFFRGHTGDVERAVETLQKAVKIDPRYAVAWARLARVYAWQGNVGELTAAKAEAKARDAVQRALAIDPDCAEAYYARGNIFFQVVGDWTAANSDYKKALTLDPLGDIGDHARRNILNLKAAMSGETDELIASLRRTLERSPLDTEALETLASIQQSNGKLAESAATFRRLLELNPAYATAQAGLGLTLLQMGKYDDALAEAEKESDEATKLQVLSCIYWAMGRRTESDSALGALEQRFATSNAYEIATVHAYRGEAAAAFAWLGRADQTLKASLLYIKSDPLLRNLHGDPRFDALLRTAKLVE
jgi:TolB-like protein/Flp pilus assembly protein TadD